MRMLVPQAPETLPWTVWAAAAALSVYGTGVLILATVQQTALGWENISPQQLSSPLSRFVGMNVVAWGLSQRSRWAWWAGLLLPGWFLAVGVAASAVYLSLPPDAPHPPVSPQLLIPFIVLLALPVIFLLMPASRRCFKPPAA